MSEPGAGVPSSSMRILVMNWRDLSHPRAGGSEVYVQEICSRWAQMGHQVTLFCSRVEGQPERESLDGYTLVRCGSRTGVYRAAKSFYINEARACTDVVLDVVNTRPFMTPRYVDLPSAALIHQVAKEVWHFEAPPGLAHLGRYVLEPKWLREYRSSPVLTVSRSSARSLQDYGLRDLSVVHEGVRDTSYRPQTKEADPTFVFVGRLSRNKRPDHAIKAFSLIRKKMPTAQMWVVGDGPMRSTLERCAPAGVTFCGRVSHGEKESLMARSHALLATSVREGWGLIVSEAALLGTRTIGYEVDGLRDSVMAAGGLLTSENPRDLARAALDVVPRWMDEGPKDPFGAGVRSWDAVAEEVLSHLWRVRYPASQEAENPSPFSEVVK